MAPSAIDHINLEEQSWALLTTNMGLEEIVVNEARRRLQAEGFEGLYVPTPLGYGGHVAVGLSLLWEEWAPIARQMRSIHHIFRLLGVADLVADQPQHGIVEMVTNLDIPGMGPKTPFRVTSRRSGQHDFSSMDVQRWAGAVLAQRYGAKVALQDFQYNVRVDVFDSRVVCSLQQTRRSLSKRYWRVYQPRAGLKGVMAYALLQWTGFDEGAKGALLDPFCGSASILIEAAQVFPHLSLVGVDLDPDAVAGARLNIADLGLQQRIEIHQGDARRLTGLLPQQRFDALVANPPFGKALGRHIDFHHLYSRFLEQAYALLEAQGRVVLLVGKRNAFSKAFRGYKDKFRQLAMRAVETGGVYPYIFVLERR